MGFLVARSVYIYRCGWDMRARDSREFTLTTTESDERENSIYTYNRELCTIKSIYNSLVNLI